MSLTALKKIQELLPEIQPLVKRASVEDGFPLGSKIDTVVSAVKVGYLTKVANTGVSDSTFNLVKKAVSLYDVEEETEELVKELVKRANEVPGPRIEERVKLAEAYFEGQLTGFMDLTKVASQAEDLWDSYRDLISSDEVKRYAGEAFLHKEAAISHLKARGHLTGKEDFTKLASLVEATRQDKITPDDVRMICRAVTLMDKQAGLLSKGMNFYKEALIVKQAGIGSALLVSLDTKQVPVESILALGPRLGQVLGDDVAKEIGSDPVTAKAVVESLPRDLKQLLLTLL